MTCFVSAPSFANDKAYDSLPRPEDYERVAHDGQPAFRMRSKHRTRDVLYTGFVSTQQGASTRRWFGTFSLEEGS